MTPSFDRVDAAAQRLFGAAPVWRFFVPGRLEVFGKHTDYAGGRSLVSAVPRGFCVAAVPGDDDRVVVVDGISGSRFACTVGEPCTPTARWQRYVVAVIRRLAANFPDANLATRIVFASDLPPAAGISSSSALIIALAEALIARSGLDTSDIWTAAIGSIEDRARYYGCIENGSTLGPLAGSGGVGTNGGSEDHAAILLSQEGQLSLLSFVPLTLERRVSMPAGWTFVVLSSGVRASKTGGARESFNRLAADAAEITRVWRERHPGDHRTLAELCRSGSISAEEIPASLVSRLDHLAAEDARVAEAAEAFSRADIDRIGVLADESHRDAARYLENQVPETVELVLMARDLGAAAVSSFGAGWGGSVWALTEEAGAERFLDAWVRAYRGRYPRRRAEGFVSPPSHGLIRL